MEAKEQIEKSKNIVNLLQHPAPEFVQRLLGNFLTADPHGFQEGIVFSCKTTDKGISQCRVYTGHNKLKSLVWKQEGHQISRSLRINP